MESWSMMHWSYFLGVESWREKSTGAWAWEGSCKVMLLLWSFIHFHTFPSTLIHLYPFLSTFIHPHPLLGHFFVWNLVKIVKFGRNCEIWSKLWCGRSQKRKSWKYWLGVEPSPPQRNWGRRLPGVLCTHRDGKYCSPIILMSRYWTLDLFNPIWGGGLET